MQQINVQPYCRKEAPAKHPTETIVVATIIKPHICMHSLNGWIIDKPFSAS